MLISYQHRFIFIHNRKVAGSSVSAYLARHLGPDDLMIGSWPEAIACGAPYNRRVWQSLATGAGIMALARSRPLRLLTSKGNRAECVNVALKRLHAPAFGGRATFPDAQVLKDWAGQDWERFFKFCFVRNPFAQAVSDWQWRTRKIDRSTVPFKEFLLRLSDLQRPDPERVRPAPPLNWPLYTIDNQIAVDFVGRLENLHDDLSKICGKLGLPFDEAAIPHMKKGPQHRYREHYDADDLDLAHRLYAREIEAFGYSF
jgi:hypothetical protein